MSMTVAVLLGALWAFSCIGIGYFIAWFEDRK
ncbi:putative signal peptide-containing lipoprotein [Bacillus phage Izhevsk]|uniref:Uncharacterized protein n=2 Tax=Tsamsavirus TaxID=3044849 RepID=U5J9K7_9CAUD|nr:hypothetical protein X915_gp039 [Bacillus phage vB_BanS-Tsamsa]YP_010680440.1 putative signal peptide-containing lipoprotein [Bacillus phage Izhevsk]AGI11992.1 hypothetical protein [Bacillus phage vB_BanS-Tsamsa]QIW89717.1 putative signal peptide-containing lipoprotein [Bacillus phage Izhevsk]